MRHSQSNITDFSNDDDDDDDDNNDNNNNNNNNILFSYFSRPTNFIGTA